MSERKAISSYKYRYNKEWYYQKDNFDNWKTLRAIDEIEDFLEYLPLSGKTVHQ